MRLATSHAVCLTTLAAIILGYVESVSVIVPTDSGFIKGDVSRVPKFLGVPYAQFPGRFNKATQFKKWSGIHEATSYGPSCYQSDWLSGSQSEDCLNLDIYTPVDLTRAQTTSVLKPVMVFIHGGGFIGGSSNFYDGTALSEFGDVVVVIIQYRLGVFGFLYTKDLTPSNLGLWDQKLALDWVNRNIQYFKGDKNKITLFGESAGAMSISCHMMSPKNNNSAFQRAILQSGSSIAPLKPQALADNSVKAVAERTSCNRRNLTFEGKVQCLKALNASELNQAALQAIMSDPAAKFGPVFGDEFLPVNPVDLLTKLNRGDSAGLRSLVPSMNQYDAIMGYNGQEGLFLMSRMKGITLKEISKGISEPQFRKAAEQNSFSRASSNAKLTQSLARTMADFYLEQHAPSNLSSSQKRVVQLTMAIGDYTLAMPTLFFGMLHSMSAPSRDTYFYLFDHIPATKSQFGVGPHWARISASHTEDLGFVLPRYSGNKPTPGVNATAEEAVLSRDMMLYWSSFAKDGNPNNNYATMRKRANWNKFTSKNKEYFHITLRKDESEKNLRSDEVDMLLCLWNAFRYENTNQKCYVKPNNSAVLSSLSISVLLLSLSLSIGQ